MAVPDTRLRDQEGGRDPGARRWLFVALGPALFLLTELLFRPVLELTPELAAANPLASSAMVCHALAVTLWIAAWWFTEAIPIPATSLLPLVLFPALGLGTVQDVSQQYAHELIFLFLGGLLIALAMETSGLHERVAIGIIRVFGQGRRAIVLGFMVATALMSMWISNTATTVMILPVALAVLRSTEDDDGKSVDSKFPVALLLGVAFAANIGGLGTPVGSAPNLVFMTVVREKTGADFSFIQWMSYGVPLIILLLPVAWWWLVRRLDRHDRSTDVELPTFGRMTVEQRWVMVVFIATATLWVTRGDFGAFAGWGERLAAQGIVLRDSSIAIAAAVVLFLAPGKGGKPVLDWSVAPRLPWGVLILMGAGFAISKAFDQSGLTLWIGSWIEVLGSLPLEPAALFLLILTAVVLVSIVVTEFASNTASASILLPIIFGVSAALGPEDFPPELLMVACAIACSTGFAVPAGTPPNALVFATERITIRRFARTGLMVDAFSLVIIVLLVAGRRILGG